MDTKITEIRQRCEQGRTVRITDVKKLLAEIDRLKMMLDAAAAGQEVLQKQWAADVERLTSELSSAVGDLNEMKNCENCKFEERADLSCRTIGGSCNYEWSGVK